MLSYLLSIIWLLSDHFLYVIGDGIIKDDSKLTHNKDNSIPLSCWTNAKQRFSIGNKGIWGPKLWHSLHCTALNYQNNPSEIDKQNYKSFYLNVHRIIPCRLCANHYKQNVINFDLDKYLNSPKDLFTFTVNIHNLVNEQLNKPSMDMDNALELYQTSCAECSKSSHTLESLINNLKPENEEPPQKSEQLQESLASIAMYGALWRLAFFAFGIIVTTALIFAYRFIKNKLHSSDKKIN